MLCSEGCAEAVLLHYTLVAVLICRNYYIWKVPWLVKVLVLSGLNGNKFFKTDTDTSYLQILNSEMIITQWDTCLWFNAPCLKECFFFTETSSALG